ncbi:hypothetical protein HAX54_046401 [Datura stramonium]|uniref:SET domain-containing protein n=1 Tax=Datura stramonium TaxID=4076 RepID=A0ABS8SRY7_DATST|nr:hypothetical protein [Datura stramonium]
MTDITGERESASEGETATCHNSTICTEVEKATNASIVALSLLAEELWAMKLGLKLLQERVKGKVHSGGHTSAISPETYTVPIFFLARYKELAVCPSSLSVVVLAVLLLLIFFGAWASLSFTKIDHNQNFFSDLYALILYQVNKRCRFLLEFEKILKHELENLKLMIILGGQDVGFICSRDGLCQLFHLSEIYLYGSKRSDGTRSNIPMMLPLIDMCNHSFDANAEIVQEEENSNRNMLVKVVAGREIKQNDPLLLNYDTRKWRACRGSVIAALRIILSNDEEAVKQHDLEALKSLTVEAPLGISTEVAALRTVVALCVIALGHFPTKIMEDGHIKQNASPTTELALQFRIQTVPHCGCYEGSYQKGRGIGWGGWLQVRGGIGGGARVRGYGVVRGG